RIEAGRTLGEATLLVTIGKTGAALLAALLHRLLAREQAFGARPANTRFVRVFGSVRPADVHDRPHDVPVAAATVGTRRRHEALVGSSRRRVAAVMARAGPRREEEQNPSPGPAPERASLV